MDLGERAADTQNFLVCLSGIEHDSVGGHPTSGQSLDRSLRSEPRSARSQANVDFAHRGSG
jgi:hypothetical protein